MEEEHEKIRVPISWQFEETDKCEPLELASFQLTCVDTSGKPIDVQVGVISGLLEINDKSRGLCEEKGRVRKTGVGTYEINFVPHLIGKHQVILQNGHITLFKNTPIFLNVIKQIPAETINYEFDIEGQGLLSGRVKETLSFNITVTDKNTPTDINTAKFSVKIFGNGKTSLAELIRTGIGTYNVSFTSPAAGIFTATVIYEETKVLKQRLDFFEVPSPFHSRVTDLTNTIPVGKPQIIYLQSLDTGGNLIGCGGDEWEVKISQTSPKTTSGTLPLKIMDEKNGSYRVEYTLPLAGTYQMNVSVNGKAIRRSPFKLTAP